MTADSANNPRPHNSRLAINREIEISVFQKPALPAAGTNAAFNFA